MLMMVGVLTSFIRLYMYTVYVQCTVQYRVERKYQDTDLITQQDGGKCTGFLYFLSEWGGDLVKLSP